MRALLIVLAALFALPAVAQTQGGQGWTGSRPFNGGTLTAPLVLSAAQTACSAALSLSFSGDANTGLQRAAADTLALCIGGAVGLQVSASGAVTTWTAATNQDILLAAAGTGSIQLKSGDDVIDIVDAADVVRGSIRPLSATVAYLGTSTTRIGAVNGIGGTGVVVRIVDTASTGLFDFYGSGAYGPTSVQSITIADDGAGTSPTNTDSPVSSTVHVTCNDANGCNYNPGETSLSGLFWKTSIVNVGAANNVLVNDSASVVEARGGASITLSPNESTACDYTGSLWSCR